MMGKKQPRMEYHMKNKVFALVFLLMLSSNSYSDTWSMEFCKSVAAEVNINLPMSVDSVTELRNAFCLPDRKGPIFNYNYVVAENIKSIPETQRDIVRRSWCTTPDLLDMLKSLSNANFSYYQEDGTFVGEFSFSKEDCD